MQQVVYILLDNELHVQSICAEKILHYAVCGLQSAYAICTLPDCSQIGR